MTNIKNFDPSLLVINKISFKSTNVAFYHIKYITMKSFDNENIDSVNYLYLAFNNVDRHIECNENKYLIFASTDKSKKY